VQVLKGLWPSLTVGLLLICDNGTALVTPSLAYFAKHVLQGRLLMIAYTDFVEGIHRPKYFEAVTQQVLNANFHC